MKKSIIALAALAFASCSPSLYQVDLDVRYPSTSGIEIPGKSVSVVCLNDGSTVDSLTLILANGFTQGIESMYYEGRQDIDILTMHKDPAGVYSNRDSLALLLMEVGTDVVFLLDVPKLNEDNCTQSIYAYDSQAALDTVKTFLSSGKLDITDEDWGPTARNFGKRMSSPLASNWKHERHSLIYYDDLDSRWVTAVMEAHDMNWKKAVEIWLQMSKGKQRSYEKRSALYYNLAVGCYMLDAFELASEWLDRSDAEMKLPMSTTLRSRIKARRTR